MLIWVLVIIAIAIIYIFRNVKIKWKTFLKKGFAPKRGNFGVYCFVAKQGQGKTYNLVRFLKENKNKKIYGNMQSIKNIEYEYINGLKELLNLREKENCIIFFDEIFTILSKDSKESKMYKSEVLDFLSQMRKRKIIFLTTAQDWTLIDLTMRKYCRYVINCKMQNILGFGIIIKQIGDAEQMIFNKDINEFECPIIDTIIEKCNISVARDYDTYEQIGDNAIKYKEKKEMENMENDNIRNKENIRRNKKEKKRNKKRKIFNGNIRRTVKNRFEKNKKRDIRNKIKEEEEKEVMKMYENGIIDEDIKNVLIEQKKEENPFKIG